jgi:hypothetical protein
MKPRISIKPGARKAFGMMVAPVLLAACATVSMPEYPRQHPANPDAIQAPAPAAPSALDTYRPAPVGKDTSGQPATPGKPSNHVGHGDSAQEPAIVPREDDHERQ